MNNNTAAQRSNYLRMRTLGKKIKATRGYKLFVAEQDHEIMKSIEESKIVENQEESFTSINVLVEYNAFAKAFDSREYYHRYAPPDIAERLFPQVLHKMLSEKYPDKRVSVVLQRRYDLKSKPGVFLYAGFGKLVTENCFEAVQEIEAVIYQAILNREEWVIG